MKCCVPSCNISKNTLNSQKVTYHKFPVENYHRAVWCAALGLEESQLPEVPMVCSLHFKDSSFYINKKGLKIVQSGAVPFVQFCMVCLNRSEDCRLYASNTYNLDMEFEHLTGISLQGLMTHFETQFCAECAQRLSNCSKFRNKSLRAYQILMGLVELDKPLTIQNIKSLCRSNNLTSSMSKKTFQPDYCDLNLIHEELQEQEKLQQELATNKVLRDLPDNELVNIQEDLLNIEPIKIEVKLFNGEPILIPIPELENKVESKSLDVMFNPVSEVENKDAPKSLDDSHDDFDINLDYIDDDNYSDIDTQCDKRTKDTVDKFMNGVMYDMDNDCIVLKDSDSDNDSVSATKTEIKSEKERISKPRPIPRKRKKVNKQSVFDLNIDYIDDDKYSDIDIHCDKRTKNAVGKFVNGVMNVTGNDCAVLKDSDSANDSVLAKKTEIIRKPRPSPRKRKKVNKKMEEEKLEYLKYFNVTKLTREEQLEDIQKRKLTENYIYGIFKCNICFRCYLNDFTYKAHMDRHTDKYGKSVCPICALHSRSDRALRYHVASTHSTRYSCLHCLFVTNHYHVATNHVKRHRGVKYECPHCPKVHSSKSGHMLHLRVSHPTDSVCTQCGYSFINERGLRTHINLKHHNDYVRNPDGPLCEECDIRFASSAAYQQHLDVSPKHAADGIRHRNAPKKITREQNFLKSKCEECGEQIRGFAKYQDHFRRMHPDKTVSKYKKQALCDQCGKYCSNEYWLKVHMLTHTGKKQFQCDICKKFSYTKQMLSVHLKSHSEKQQVYACAVCDKKFLIKANCKRHLWSHEEQKPHRCQMCDKSFVSACDLRAHVAHAHFKKPYPKKSRGPHKRVSRARHDKEPVCGTIWPKDCVTADGQSAHTLDSRQLAAREPQRTLLDAQRV